MEEMNYNASQEVPQPPKDGVGAKIGAAIVVIIVVLGGIYFVNNYVANSDERAAQQDAQDTAALEMEIQETNNVVEQLNTQSDSTTLQDIEADLNATNWGDVSSEIDNIAF